MDVIAVASRDRARAETCAREHSIEHAYESYDALLQDPAVEPVYISLPNSMHVEWTVRARAARKHVLCEKPFSRRANEVEEAFDLADKEGLVLSEGFMWRHHPQTASCGARPGLHELETFIPAKTRSDSSRRCAATIPRWRRGCESRSGELEAGGLN